MKRHQNFKKKIHQKKRCGLKEVKGHTPYQTIRQQSYSCYNAYYYCKWKEENWRGAAKLNKNNILINFFSKLILNAIIKQKKMEANIFFNVNSQEHLMSYISSTLKSAMKIK